MSYRNGTYIAFHAGGTSDPTASDMKYYRLLQAWHEHDDIDFKFVNSHEKAAAVRDSSTRQTLIRSLHERLNNSKNLLLIVGPTTAYDVDWVPHEISYAVDHCRIPLICAYTGYIRVRKPIDLYQLWPAALRARIQNGTARAVHIGFQRVLIDDAIRRFNLTNLPAHGMDIYTDWGHQALGAQ